MANYPVVPQTYKGKDTGKMSRAEYEKMLQDLGINKKGVKATEYPGEEPDDATAPKKKMAVGGMTRPVMVKSAYAKGGSVKSFKVCKGCPTPAKCKAAGKCMAKKAAAGMLVIPVKMEKAKKKVKK